MISRVAEQCFWFGRYLDRAESTARLLQATRSLVFDADIPVTRCWQPLVIVSGEYPRFLDVKGADAAGDGETVQRYMTWDEENTVSLRRSIAAARDCARSIRDVLSLEAWEEINELYLWTSSPEAHAQFDQQRERFYRHVRRVTQLVLGLVRSTMLHDAPMSFLWAGVMLERVGQTARILDVHHHMMEWASPTNLQPGAAAYPIVEVALWLSLLRACSGHEAFMKKSQGRVTAASVVSFLLFEPQFPRSLRYCLRSAMSLLRQLWPPTPASGGERPSQTRLRDLVDWLDSRRDGFDLRRIHDLLTHVVDETSFVASAIERDILGPRVDPRQTQGEMAS